MNSKVKDLIKRAAFVITPLLSLVFVFGVPPLYADLYKWEDANGVLHITDNLGNVPESKRRDVKIFKRKPETKRRLNESSVYIPPTKAVQKSPTLYGGQTIEWWQAAFDKLNEDMDRLRDDIEKKTQFIVVFEGGRRFGQIFGDAELANYKRYKQDITKDKEDLTELEDKLEKLRREARIEEVPREIRGE